jgi:PAS fold
MRGMVDASTLAMFLIDHKGQCLIVNSAGVSMFEWIENAFLNSNISMRVGKDYAAHHDALLKRFLGTWKRALGKERHLMRDERTDPKLRSS